MSIKKRSENLFVSEGTGHTLIVFGLPSVTKVFQKYLSGRLCHVCIKFT
jgi:hypothetical protein